MQARVKCLKCGSWNTKQDGELFDLLNAVRRFMVCGDCDAMTVVEYGGPYSVEYWEKDKDGYYDSRLTGNTKRD